MERVYVSRIRIVPLFRSIHLFSSPILIMGVLFQYDRNMGVLFQYDRNIVPVSGLLIFVLLECPREKSELARIRNLAHQFF